MKTKRVGTKWPEHKPSASVLKDAVALLAVAEVRSALLTKERAGRISHLVRLAGWRLFQDKVRDQEFVLLPLNRQVIERAGAVIDQCHPKVPLRTLDAIHVATAELHGGE